MKNGVNLVLILFLGIMGYYVVNGLYLDNNMMLAGMVFLLVSVVITFFTTHFKKKMELVPAQKVINIVYISLFAIYGIVVGLSIMVVPSLQMTTVGFEGPLFLFASGILFYGLFVFMRTKMLKGL